MVLSYAVLLSIGVIQSFEDVDTHRVRVAVTHLAGVWTAMTLGVATVIDSNFTALLRMLAAAGVTWFLLWVLGRFSRGSVGTGDLRLAPVVGAALGYLSIDALAIGMAGMSTIGAIWGVSALVRYGRSARIPYVPSMYSGLLIALLVHG